MKDVFYGFFSMCIILYISYMFLSKSDIKRYDPKYKISNNQFFEYFYLTDSIYVDKNVNGVKFINILDNKEHILSNYNITILK